MPPAKEDIQRMIFAEARRQGLDPRYALAVARQESNFNPNAVGDNGKSLGLFQLQRAAAIDAGIDPDRRGDLRENIRGGVTYLKQKFAQSGGNVDQALSRYNRGTPTYRGIGDPNYVQNVKRYVGGALNTLGRLVSPASAEAAESSSPPDRTQELLRAVGGKPAEPAPARPASPATAPAPDRTQELLQAVQGTDAPEARGQVDGEGSGTPGTAQTAAPSLGQRLGQAAEIASRGIPGAERGRQVIQRQFAGGAERGLRGMAASGINLVGELAGAGAGTAIGGPGVGTALGSMAGGLASRQLNIELGLEEPGASGDVLAVAPGIVTGALQGFKAILRGTAGARQLQRTAAISTAQTAADAQRAELQGVQEQIGAIAGETARGQQQLASQGTGLRQAMRGGLQARVAETEDLGGRLTAGAQAGLQSRAERLGAVQTRLQTAGQTRLGQVTGPQVDALVHQMANTGRDVSDDAIKLAYQQIEQYAGLRLPRRRLDTALTSIAPPVRRGLREVLSVIPGVPRGTPAQSIANTMTFEQLRSVQRQVGQNIRVLERQVALGSDVAAPQRLTALKRVYAATFDTLDDAVELARLPAEAKIALQEANTLNRIAATFDRVDTLREVHGTRTVGGEIVFDAQNLRAAIKKDGFLVKQLTNLGIYDGLDATLGRIAVAQRGKLPAPGTVKVAPLRLGDRPTFESLPLAQRQAAREGVMLRTGRQAKVQGAQASVRAKRQTVDEELAATLADINTRLPEVAPGLPLGRATAGIAGIMSLGLATGRTGTASAISATLAGLQGISHYLLTAQGQRVLERVLSNDPTLSLNRMRLLGAALRPEASTPTAQSAQGTGGQ